MDSTVDYRGLKVNRGDKWYHDDDKGFELCWSSIPGPESSRTLIVSGRDVKVDRTKGEHCVLEFDEFCRKPRGAADYLALGAEFKSVMIRGVPKMRIEDFNVLRRFIVLIDCLYSEGVKLTVSSEAQVRAGCGSGGLEGRGLEGACYQTPSFSHAFARNSRQSPRDVFDPGDDGGERDEVFSWDRTRSRMEEMGSKVRAEGWGGRGEGRERSEVLIPTPFISERARQEWNNR
jgi:predicted ATPase